MKAHAAAALILASILAAPACAESCKHSAERGASVQGGGIRKVVIGAGAGNLVVRGETGQDGVRADGRACASSQELLPAIQIESRREGDTVHLKTVLPDPKGRMFATAYAHLDLTVSMPRSAALSLKDSSGDLQVSGVQAAVIVDGSGEQDVRKIAGDLDVSDSSGELRIAEIGGKASIRDSSGDIEVDDVRGDVVVTVDSSGDLAIRKAGGSVHVLTDSSGDIEISGVQRDVTIDEDSSGSIRVQQVGGNFTVGNDGSGGISHERVLGTVCLPDTRDSPSACPAPLRRGGSGSGDVERMR